MNRTNETRLFYVVDEIGESDKCQTPKIFTTYGEAKERYDEVANDSYWERKPRMYIAEVQNACQEEDGSWSYTDLPSTLNTITFI